MRQRIACAAGLRSGNGLSQESRPDSMELRMKGLRLSIVLGSVLLFAVSVRASAIQFTFNFSRLQTGTITVNHGSDWSFSESVYAGKGTATVLDNGLAPDLSQGQSFDTYCVDLFHTIYSGTSPQVTLGSMQDWSMTNAAGGPYPGSFPWSNNPDAGRAAAFLYNTYRDDGKDQSHKEYREAGLQLAIWEVLYEGSAAGSPSFDIGTGNVSFTNFNTQVTNYAVSYLNGLAAHGDLSGSDALWLQSADQGTGFGDQTQDFIAPVSEPESLLLVGSGMLLVSAASALQGRKKPK